MRTFAELFCQHYHVVPARFALAFFWVCLHRRAWIVAPLLLVLNRNFFAADFDLISHVGAMRSPRTIHDAIDDFQLHPDNHGLLHRRCKIRMSVERTIRVVHRVFVQEQHRSAAQAGQRG